MVTVWFFPRWWWHPTAPDLRLFRRIDYVVGSDSVNADSNRRQSTFTSWLIDTGVPAALWPSTVTVTVPASARADVRCRNGRRPCTVCQYGGCVGFTALTVTVNAGTRCQTVAGAGDNQVLSVFDAADHRRPRHLIDPQAGRLASIVMSRSPEPVLPWPLVTLADTVRSPLPMAVNTSDATLTDQLKSSCTVVGPVLPPTEIVTVSPIAAPCSLSRSGFVRQPLRRVNHVVGGNRINGDLRQRAVDQHAMAGASHYYPQYRSRWPSRT